MEIVKLIVAALTPLSVAAIGVALALSSRRFERANWANQKLVEKRIEILSEALPKLNDLYCYFCWVGAWASFSPADMVRHKRQLDRLFHANQAFFTAGALVAYEDFANNLFRTYVAPGVDACLRTGLTGEHGDRRAVYPEKWQEKWDTMFVEATDRVDPDLVKLHYRAFIARLGLEVGVGGKSDDRAVSHFLPGPDALAGRTSC